MHNLLILIRRSTLIFGLTASTSSSMMIDGRPLRACHEHSSSLRRIVYTISIPLLYKMHFLQTSCSIDGEWNQDLFFLHLKMELSNIVRSHVFTLHNEKDR